MDIDLRRHVVGLPPTALWGWLTDPARMNHWSTARIEPIDPGEGGRMDGVGALRRVITPGIASTRLLEVVRISEPPHRFVYVVFDGAPALRRHQGEITLQRDGDGTVVRWRVTMDFALPGLGAIAHRSIAPELARSLAAMEVAARHSPPEDMPRFATITPVDLAPLRAEADRVLAAQRLVADRLERAGDPKQWFARVYAFVTEEQLAHLDRGEVDHPDWALRLVPCFHRYYVDALEGFEAGRTIAAPWQRAWSTAQSAKDGRAIVTALLQGVAAHIESDLPHALAETWRDHFRERLPYVRFRADYVRMGSVFRRASDRLMERMPRAFVPAWLRLARASVPPELGETLMRRYYDVPKRRLKAFARGAVLAHA